MSTAIEVIKYNANSVKEATVMAAACNFESLSLVIKTKNTINDIMTKTITKIPENSPVLALAQSTE